MIRVTVSNSIDSSVEVTLIGDLTVLNDEGNFFVGPQGYLRAKTQIAAEDVPLLMRALNVFNGGDVSLGLTVDIKSVESPVDEPDSFEDGDSPVYDVGEFGNS